MKFFVGIERQMVKKLRLARCLRRSRGVKGAIGATSQAPARSTAINPFFNLTMVILQTFGRRRLRGRPCPIVANSGRYEHKSLPIQISAD
jgi:hypothetical protein